MLQTGTKMLIALLISTRILSTLSFSDDEFDLVFVQAVRILTVFSEN